MSYECLHLNKQHQRNILEINSSIQFSRVNLISILIQELLFLINHVEIFIRYYHFTKVLVRYVCVIAGIFSSFLKTHKSFSDHLVTRSGKKFQSMQEIIDYGKKRWERIQEKQKCTKKPNRGKPSTFRKNMWIYFIHTKEQSNEILRASTAKFANDAKERVTKLLNYALCSVYVGRSEFIEERGDHHFGIIGSRSFFERVKGFLDNTDYMIDCYCNPFEFRNIIEYAAGESILITFFKMIPMLNKRNYNMMIEHIKVDLQNEEVLPIAVYFLDCIANKDPDLIQTYKDGSVEKTWMGREGEGADAYHESSDSD